MKIVLIIVLGLLVYGNILSGDFIWDDESIVRDNECIRSLSNIPLFFTRDIKGNTDDKTTFYRPLQVVTYTIDYALWKLNARGYHFTNIMLHIFVALALYWLISIIYNNKFLALLTSLLFITHPIHTEAIAYISGRADPMAVLFMLLSFIFYIRQPLFRGISTSFLIILSYAFALLSKEYSLVLPFLLLLYHYASKSKIKTKQFSYISAIALLYLLLRSIFFRPWLYHEAGFPTLFQRIPGFFVAITNYVSLLLLPFDLHMEYGAKLFDITDPKTIIGMVILFLSLIYAIRKRKSNSLIFFSVMWFFVALLPMSNLYPINAYMAEHWLYLPSIGFFLILAYELSRAYKIKKFKNPAIIFITIILFFYSYLTIKQNNYWKDEIKFYKRTLIYEPDSYRVYYNLGLAYYNRGRASEARGSYEMAVKINPKYKEAYNNLGVIYKEMNNEGKAVSLFKKAIEIDPAYIQAYENLYFVYMINGRERETKELEKKAKDAGIELNYADIYNKIALAYYNAGKHDDAVRLLKMAMESNPKYTEAYNNLGIIYAASGEKEYSKALFKKVIEINPNYAKAYNNLAVAYFQDGQYGLAIKYCDKAKKLGFANDALLECLKPYRKQRI